MSRYITTGFEPLHRVAQDGLLPLPAAAVNIVKGSLVHDDGNGFATNTFTAFDDTFLGVAAAACDNSGGAAGDKTVYVIPPRPDYKFRVKCLTATAAATDRGEIIDIDSVIAVDPSDTSCSKWGFQVEKIDISAPAVAANTNGFVIGRFIRVAA